MLKKQFLALLLTGIAYQINAIENDGMKGSFYAALRKYIISNNSEDLSTCLVEISKNDLLDATSATKPSAFSIIGQMGNAALLKTLVEKTGHKFTKNEILDISYAPKKNEAIMALLIKNI